MLRDIAVGGAPIVAMSVAVSAQIYIDANVLAQLATPAATGWYAAAKNFMGALVTPASIIVSAAYPRLSRAAPDPALFRRELSATMRPVLTLGALGAAGTYLFADLAVSVVYGRAKFAPAIAILQIFAPSLLLFFVDGLLSNAIIAAGRPKRLASAKVVSILIGTALDLALVPYFQARHGNGGLGIILAFCGSEVAMLCFALWLVPRGALAPSLLLDSGRAVAAGAGSLALVLLLPPLSPFVQLPICVVSYFALALLLGLLRRSDLELLRSLARRG
jgi:O-antigen/teichoic acid export membrane protein